MNCHNRSVAQSVALALAVSAVPALAQENTEQGLQEVTVTAQFREQNLQQTPIAITAITGEMLEARSQTKLADITAQSPNVLLQVNPAGGGNSMRAFIRGVGQGDQSPSVDPGVGIYVDDVYFSTITGSIFELLDLDRVEILRGPQGTLSGMNSMGGSVKLFSRKPDGTGGYVEATVGDFDRRDIRASADFALIEDRLFARVSGISRQRDGYITRLDYACVNPDDDYVESGAIPRTTARSDCKIGTLGAQQLGAVRGALRWIANDAVEVNGPNRPATARINDPFVTYANFINPGTTFTPLDPAGTAGANNGTFYADPANEYDGWGLSNSIDWKLSDTYSLKFITGYREYTTLSGQDNDGSPVAILQSLSDFGHEQFSQEIRFNGAAVDGKVEYTLGGIYYEQETLYATRESDPFIPFTANPFDPPIFDFIQRDTTNNKFTGVFAHGVWHATDKLNVALGVRRTKQDKEYEFMRLNVDGVNPFQPLSNPANPLNGRVGTFEGSHTDYRVNLDYQWTDDVMTYIQYATGFKGGGISPRPYFPEQVLGFGPEELEAYEFGFKTRWFGNRIQANGAIFYNDYLGYQATPNQCVDESGEILPPPFGNAGLCGQYLNVADAEVKGAELELEFYPFDGMMIEAAYSTLDFKFGTPFIATTSVIAGRSAPGLGDTKWSIGAQYEFGFSNGATLTPRVDIVHTPEYCGDLNCTPRSFNEEYDLVNARLTFRSPAKDWNVALEMTNVTDELYDLNMLNTVYASSQPGMPRAWAITLRRNF
jgi:iron complex outermembrane recepter protein